MTLEMVERGLWVDASIDGAATHAIVIGVSDYPHLDGGTGATSPATFGLGQLIVSSLTAFDIFEWLRDTYHHERAPIASVELLLAPNAAELGARPSMVDTYRLADYDGCEFALNSWRQRLLDLADNVAKVSRAAFFYSGHGLEISQQKQILLPSDYLDPDRPSVNRALSTLNIKQGLLSFKVPDQLFFIDACRNGSRHLAGVQVDGNSIFNDMPPHHNNPDARSALMYGTASGLQSWQPDSVDGGPSLFGTALLEAVTGGSDFDPDETPPTIWFNEVAAYANRAIRRQLRERGARVRQAISGDLAFVDVVHADGSAARSDGGGMVVGGLVGAGAGTDLDGDGDTFFVAEPCMFEPPAILFGGRAPHGAVVEPADDEWVAVSGDANPLDWFGRESLTAVWVDNTDVVDLVTGNEVGFDVTSVDRLDADQHRVHFVVHSHDPAWLTIGAPNAGYAAVLPGGHDLAFELGLDWNGDALEHVEVDLSISSPHPVDETARLWIDARQTTPARAARSISPADLELATQIVASKIASPLAPLGALVASLVLLRAGGTRERPAVPESWARNMAHLTQFRHLPDGITVWAEVVSRLGPEAGTSPSAALSLLRERDFAPITHDGLSYGMAGSELAAATVDDGPAREAMLEISAWLSEIGRASVPGGLFLVLRRSGAPPDRSTVLNRLRST